MPRKNTSAKIKAAKQTLPAATIKEMANRLNPNSPYYEHEQNKRPRFAVFLGAGASIESGVHSANRMIEDFIKRICAVECPEITKDGEKDKWLKDNKYYNTNRDKYGALFEKCFQTESDRRDYIESQVDGKVPSLGYIALAHLIKQKIVDTIITTNFDDLIFTACISYTDIRPVVYSLGGFASEISGTTNRPRVLKLHGDFLFSSLKNTKDEIKKQDLNMLRQVQQILEFYHGIVVIGYSGNDSSIIDLLSTLPNGKYLYWCVYKDEKVNEDVEKLIKAKNGRIVRTEGFDKLFNEIREIVGIKDEDIFSLFDERRRKIEEELKKFNPEEYNEFESARLLVIKGESYHIKENYEKALQFYNEALKINPKFSIAYNNIANIADYVELNSSKAEELYRKAIECMPNYYAPYNNLALNLIRQNKFEEAERLLEKALDLSFFLGSVQLSLACLYKKIGNFKKFSYYIDVATESIFKEDLYELACFHALIENKSQTLKFLKSSVKKEPFRKKTAVINPKFDWIRNDARFKKIIAE